MTIVFMGTPDFAVPSLRKLIEEFNVAAVFTQPDRPKGRGNKVNMSPIKELALKYNIPVYQPEKIKNDRFCIDELKRINPDFIIVVAFGQILPEEILNIPKFACINLHASLLPEYRGAAPINWAVINGETKSGNTTMLMSKGLDTGDILLKSEVDISKDMTAGNLHDVLMNNGADLLVQTIIEYEKGNIYPVKQDDSKSSYASMLGKDMAQINWKLNCDQICNFIRGLNPRPIAYTHYNDMMMKVYEAKTLWNKTKGTPGEIILVSAEGIQVAAKDGIILITKIQFPGGKPMEVREYIKGNKINEGNILV